MTFASLLTDVKSCAGELRRSGVGRNDRVAIVMPNSAETVVTLFATICCATAAPLNPSHCADEFAFYFSDLGIKAVMLQQGFESAARTVALERGIPIIEIAASSDAAKGNFERKSEPIGITTFADCTRPEEEAIVLHTSGTTSRPKIVPLSQANVLNSAGHIIATLCLTEADRCLTVMPLFHIHGIMVTLSALIAGGTVCPVLFEPNSFFQYMDNFSPSWYSAVPTMHQAILRSAESHQDVIARKRLRFLRSSSAALPPKVMTALERLFGAPVVEAYGMTEASHQMASNPLPPGKCKHSSVGLAAGPKVAIMDDAGNCLNAGQTGEIVIQGPNLFQGYESNAAANADAFIHGWFRTGDQGYLDSDGYLFITGRLKDIINRGGEKISPAEIDEILLSHPAVEQAIAFPVSHPTLGEDIVAAVVLQPNATATSGEVRGFVAARVAGYKVPQRVLIVKEIPKGSTGKMQRRVVAEKLSHATSREGAATAAPQNEMEAQLVRLWEKVLRLQPVGVKDNFFELGGDSLLALNLVAELTKEYKRNFPVTLVFQSPTIEEMAVALSGDNVSDQPSVLVTLQNYGTKPAFFCVYGVRSWARNLEDPSQPFYALAPHGQDGRQAPSTVEAMAADYVREIKAVQPEGPYFLAGYSFGGIAAFETAQQLQKCGDEIALLLLIDPSAPAGIERTLHSRVEGLRSRMRYHWHSVSEMPFGQRFAKLKMLLMSKFRDIIYGVVCRFYLRFDRELPPFVRTFYFLSAALQASRRYKPQVYTGRIVLLQAEQSVYDTRSIWSRLASDGIEAHVLSGDHVNIAIEPQARSWAQRIRECLQTAQTRMNRGHGLQTEPVFREQVKEA